MNLPSRKTVKDWLVNGTLTLVVMAGALGIADAAYEQNHVAQLTATVQTSNNRHHAQTKRQNNTIINQNKVIINQNAVILQGESIITQGENTITTALADHTNTLNTLASEVAATEALQKDFVNFVATLPGDSQAIVSGQVQLQKEIATQNAALAKLQTEVAQLEAQTQ